MLDAAITALSQLFTQPLRAVLMKAVGLALLLIVIVGIVLNRIFYALAASGATSMLGSHQDFTPFRWMTA